MRMLRGCRAWSPTLSRGYRWLIGALWVLFLLTLPLESSPLLPRIIGGRAVVRPLALLPMMALFFLEVLPTIWRRPWPRPFLALLAFWLVALASGLWGWLLLPTPEQGISPTSRILRGWMTLAVGSGFYTVTWVRFQNLGEEDLRRTLRWLYVALALVLLWSGLQILYILGNNETLWQALNRWHRAWISTRPLQYRRVSGLTYEPSWLAIQLLVVFYPWLVASWLLGVSIVRLRWRWLVVELLLLAGLSVTLFFTFSRVGLGMFLFLSLVALSVRLLTLGRGSWRTRVLRGGLAVLVLLLFGTAALWGMYRWNEYVFEHFSRLVARLQRRADEFTASNVLRILAGSRWGEWQYGYAVYQTSPWMGVGLGLAPFYLEENVPSGEVSDWFYDSLLPGNGGEPMLHPRNLYIRLLAETGWVGWWLFLGFQLSTLGLALRLTLAPQPLLRVAGWSGLLALAALFLAAIGFDSFSLPHQWFVYGWIAGLATGLQSHAKHPFFAKKGGQFGEMSPV